MKYLDKSKGMALAILSVLFAVTSEAQNLPAIPGLPFSEGFGLSTPAGSGRGGGGGGTTIYLVSNGNDSGPGSLRDALEASGTRFVVFEWSGIIELRSQITVTNPYLTVAGHTAPGPVIVKGYPILLLGSTAHDILIQHIGNVIKANVGETDGLAARQSSHDFVIDHCLSAWGLDEVGSFTHGANNFSILHSIIAEGPQNAGHPQSNHSRGFHLSRTNHVLAYGSLWGWADTRNPNWGKTSGYPPASAALVRNVIYNWGSRGTHAAGSDGGTNAKCVTIWGNSYISGPSTSAMPIEVSDAGPLWEVCVDNNMYDGTVYSTANGDAWGLVTGNGEAIARVDRFAEDYTDGAVMFPNGAPAFNVEDVEQYVKDNAGPRRSDPDPWTARYLQELATRTGLIPNHMDDVGGFAAHPVPTRTHTLNIPANPNGIVQTGSYAGYTVLEAWSDSIKRSIEGSAPTSVSDNGRGNLVDDFVLHQNYPNPFNPTTTIGYALPRDERVRLEIYDVLGRLVRTLVDEHQEAGSKSVTLEAKNLPSGTYMYRLSAGEFIETKTLLLLK